MHIQNKFSLLYIIFFLEYFKLDVYHVIVSCSIINHPTFYCTLIFEYVIESDSHCLQF